MKVCSSQKCCLDLYLLRRFILVRELNEFTIMEKDDILLGMEMGRLEIEPVKHKTRSIENPFLSLLQKRNISKSTVLPKEFKCTCSLQKKSKHSGVYKKKNNKILKEPVLKILKNCGSNIILETENQETTSQNKPNMTDIDRCDPLSLCTLVDNCNQLTISSSANVQNIVGTGDSYESRWWKNDIISFQENKEPKPQSSRSGSCSQQALNPPCDVTIDELASYFETLVHIPKKMSSMAEMMYI